MTKTSSKQEALGDPSIALFGSALDTGNLGVAALATAVIEGAARCLPQSHVTVFDNGWGQRPGQVVAGDTTLAYTSSGARYSRRYHQPETLQTMYALARFGGLGNPGVQTLKQAAATLDVSGGDSFTDMYGEKTFRLITLPKLLALRAKSPLILLPQTYGPFYSDDARKVASGLIRRSHAAWARDEKGFHTLQEMAGADFDAEIHRQGVDMAFGLTPSRPQGSQADELRAWLDQDGPVAGINVSGLLVGAKPANMTYDKIAIDYELAMQQLVQRLHDHSDARLLMVPHVSGSRISEESDDYAVAKVVEAANIDPDRVRIVRDITANEAKWWVGQCDWFCGTRMHSTIAALSSGVPSAAVAYSLKTQPVFATVGQQDHVVDARSATSTEECVDAIWESWLARDQARSEIASLLPAVKDQVASQMDTIMTMCADLAGASR